MQEHPFYKQDENYLIRTVTHYQLGKLFDLNQNEIILAEASWVADTGRFSEALAKGPDALEEVEYIGSFVLINRSAVIDAWPWNHALPDKTV